MDGYTNVCEATSQSLDYEGFRPTHRKGKKLLAEKKRRARINNCLMRIRDIVCNGEEEKETDLDKMEKAEILEKTLEVLTRVRHDFDTTRKMGSLSTQKAMAVRYASGFTSCAEESIRYIQSSRLVPVEVKHQLQAHLRSIAHRMENRVQEERCESYPHPYATPPSVVIAPPQIVPLSSATTPHLPSSSLSFMVSDNSDVTARLHISPSRNYDFHPSNVRNSDHSTEIILSSSQMDWNQHPSIPSPIRSSTPVTHHVDGINKPVSPIPNKIFHEHNNSTTFIPIGIAELPQDHKENRPDEYHSNIPISPESERRRYESSIGSAFHKITPRQCESSSPRTDDQSHQTRRNTSMSSSSPSVFSSSLYSPISPVQSPVIVHTSSVQPRHQSTSSDSHPIYSYHGYEPYPTYHHTHTAVTNTVAMPTLGKSPSDLQLPQTPNQAMDLCVKRNDSHNISPETMWRPW